MSHTTEIPYYCPYCENETSIAISIESPSEYYTLDECCPNCDAQIEGGTIDKIAQDAAEDFFITEGNFSVREELE